MDASMLVFDPVAPCHTEPQQLRHALDGLAGKRVGFIDNAKPNFDHLADDLAELLVSRYGVAAVIKRRKKSAGVPAPDSMLQEIADQCDAVITGSGD